MPPARHHYDFGVAKLELTRDLSMNPDDAWAHASDLAEMGDWLIMHEGWRAWRKGLIWFRIRLLTPIPPDLTRHARPS